MNYIRHLNEFYTRLYHDKNLTAHHVSLYMALFQLWNQCHFAAEFPVNRLEVMQLSKIGSSNTYLRCLRQLTEWKYLIYIPSKKISVGSIIRITTFDATTDTPVIRLNKPLKTLQISKPRKDEVLIFFDSEKFPSGEAEKFFNHYQATGWMMGQNPIQNWQAAAINWMLNAEKFKPHEKPQRTHKKDHSAGHLNATTDKQYNEPL
ncbi:MAG: hypothetical protein ABI390_11305 [Daejeonella sp.]